MNSSIQPADHPDCPRNRSSNLAYEYSAVPELLKVNYHRLVEDSAQNAGVKRHGTSGQVSIIASQRKGNNLVVGQIGRVRFDSTATSRR